MFYFFNIYYGKQYDGIELGGVFSLKLVDLYNENL